MALFRFITRVRAVGGVADVTEYADATRYGPGSFRSGLFAGVEAVYFPYRECAFKAYGNAPAVG